MHLQVSVQGRNFNHFSKNKMLLSSYLYSDLTVNWPEDSAQVSLRKIFLICLQFTYHLMAFTFKQSDNECHLAWQPVASNSKRGFESCMW